VIVNGMVDMHHHVISAYVLMYHDTLCGGSSCHRTGVSDVLERTFIS